MAIVNGDAPAALLNGDMRADQTQTSSSSSQADMSSSAVATENGMFNSTYADSADITSSSSQGHNDSNSSGSSNSNHASQLTNGTEETGNNDNNNGPDLDNISWANRMQIEEGDDSSSRAAANESQKQNGSGGESSSTKRKEKKSAEKKEKKKEKMEESEQKPTTTTVATTPNNNNNNTSSTKKRKKKRGSDDSDADDEQYEPGDDEDFRPAKKKKKKADESTASSSAGKPKKNKVVTKQEVKEEIEEEVADGKSHKKKKKTTVEVKEEASSSQGSATKKRVKKKEEEEEVWRWWEEDDANPEASQDGSVKWRTLVHKGPMFAPPYVRLPSNVKFKYDGKPVELSEAAEEVASFYAKMLDHDYTSKPVFNQNFFRDFRKTMTSAERAEIKDLTKCDFREMHAYYVAESEKRKARSKEEKKAEKEAKEAEAKVYGFAMLDGYKQKVGNFRIEPPGLFRGRGDHPKMGSLKKRVRPEDVIINCSKGVKIMPPEGHKWKEIRHDNTVTWLASWTENVLSSNKYIMLNPSSKLKGQKDWEKFEKARKLKSYVQPIREQYVTDFKSKEMRIRQRSVALYFIDKLALRAGNEKDTDEAADTVGCCSLRCEHIKLHEEMDGQKYVVEFDFLGKDSIRYYNRVPVEKQVFKNLNLFMEGKEPHDDLFDRLDTSSLNQYLKELMDGLTAKVFRTYNASITLQEQLDKLTNPSDSVHEKLLSYNRANREVAILCNHQRAVPKTHEKSMENLGNKISEKKKEYKEVKAQLKKNNKDEKLRKKYERLKEQISKLKTQQTDREENKQIALGTSKLNYLDPRISVAWCKKYDVPLEKIFNKTQRDKFRWAIDMAKEDFIF